MAVKAIGTKLKKGTTVIAELTSISGVELSADTIETTALDTADGYRTFAQGLKDGGEVSISGYFNPGTGTGQQDLLTAFENGTADTYTIDFPPAIGYNWTFQGIVTKFATNAELEDLISFEATFKVTGKPTLAADT
jgi:predicted secreted protein